MRETPAPPRRAQLLVLACTLLLALPVEAYSPHTAAKGGGRFYPPAEAAALIEKGACEESWFPQVLDHFAFNTSTTPAGTWQQRYFICQGMWKKPGAPKDPAPGPIFFYTGNEASVEGYVKATGLMWENAAPFSALLLFAEHRYYGKSLPFGEESFARENLHLLTHEQAMADYAHLLTTLKKSLRADDAPTIAFGGSYGGMLASWFRLKYPHVVVGAIAASAPILAFPGLDVKWDTSSYWAVVTRDTLPENGGVVDCAMAYTEAWAYLFDKSSAAGLKELTGIFGTCAPLGSARDVERLAVYLAVAIDTMAMGNFPYPSDYLTGGAGQLPAWPVRAACTALLSGSDVRGSEVRRSDVRESEAAFPGTRFGTRSAIADPAVLLDGMRAAAMVFYNASGEAKCLELPDDGDYDGVWNYQYCTELLPQETYFAMAGSPNDMFWKRSWSDAQVDAHCMKLYGVKPRRDWIAVQYGGLEGMRQASNIVFTNGGLDPWSAGGVLESLSPTVVSIFIPEGAHHLDLFFSRAEDPPCVRDARAQQVVHMHRWVAEARAAAK